jgi:DNA polymerase (family 10)
MRDTDEVVTSRSEEEIYRTLGMEWIPPELREERGEIEAAMEKLLPRLVQIPEIKGDLHIHTDWSEGNASIIEMAQTARRKGLEYIAITDHSRALGIANGLDEKRLRKQIREIDGINNDLEDFTILRGIECDIMADGTTDLPASVLKELDWVVGSIHSGLRQKEEIMTDRLIKAISNPHVDAIGHPTGRIIQRRSAYKFDKDKVFEACADNDVFLEINAYPERLDLNDVNCRTASEYGVKMYIGTDSHDPSHIDFLSMGVGVARRGWLEAKDILNTLTAEKIKFME